MACRVPIKCTPLILILHSTIVHVPGDIGSSKVCLQGGCIVIDSGCS